MHAIGHFTHSENGRWDVDHCGMQYRYISKCETVINRGLGRGPALCNTQIIINATYCAPRVPLHCIDATLSYIEIQMDNVFSSSRSRKAKHYRYPFRRTSLSSASTWQQLGYQRCLIALLIHGAKQLTQRSNCNLNAITPAQLTRAGFRNPFRQLHCTSFQEGCKIIYSALPDPTAEIARNSQDVVR